VIEQIIAEDIEPLVTNAFVTVIVRPVNDHPVIMIIEQGNNIIPESNRLLPTIDQIPVNSAANNQHTLLVVAYDVDVDDELKVLIDLPVNGESVVSPTITQVNLLPDVCFLPWEDMKLHWEEFSFGLWENVVPLDLPAICNIDQAALVPGVLWSVTEVIYQPNQGFFGVDEFKVHYNKLRPCCFKPFLEIFCNLLVLIFNNE